MTTEEKAKAYDKALTTAKQIISKDCSEVEKLCLECVFPELAESEEEKIRKALVQEFKEKVQKNFEWKDGIPNNAVLAWLEKQKERKPAEWSEEDEGELQNAIDALEFLGKKGVYKSESGYDSALQAAFWLKSLKPQSKAEWSEEDENMMNNILRVLSAFIGTVECESNPSLSTSYPTYLREIDWLKSLRPQQKDDKCISPKEGDIVVNKYGDISVFENWGHHPDGGSFNDKTYFFAKCTLKGDCYNDYDCHPDSKGLRYATPEEIRKIVPYLLKSLRPQKLDASKLENFDPVDVLNRIKTEWPMAWEKAVGKQEWDEFDEDCLKRAIWYVENPAPSVVKDTNLALWLKSLRPQPPKELSIEKAIKWFDDTFYILNNSSDRGRDCKIITHDFDSLEEMYDSFRKAVIVDSEPQWEPSERQINALLRAVKKARIQYFTSLKDDGYIALNSLYEQLKRLRG